MRRDLPAVAFASVLALAAWCGLSLQFVLSVGLARSSGHGSAWGAIMYFGYFTILTNLLVAVVTSAPLVAPRSRIGRLAGDGRVATGVCCSILLVGIAYHFLLRNTWDPRGAQEVADTILHYVTPGLFLVYWVWLVPKEGVSWRAIPLWCAYPAAYFVYALIRGLWIGVYPYPFIDVLTLGYGGTLASAGAILAAFVLLGVGLVLVGKLQQARARATSGRA